ncbi:MAG: chromosome condensation protein [Phycisphaerales bacterium]
MDQPLSDLEYEQRSAAAAQTGFPVSKRREDAAAHKHIGVARQPAPRATLAFTTLEEWLFWEDRPAYPWSCFIRLHFTGQLDRAAFETAACRVLRRHPLFCAKARMRGRMHLEWVVQDDPQPTVTWQSGAVGGAFPAATSVDLFQEIGIRFHVVSDGRRCDLTLQFHHACCDGVGILAFIDELLIAYALALGAVSDGLRLPPLEPERLIRRDKFGLTFGKRVRMAPGRLLGLDGAAKFLLRSPATIVPHQPCEDDGPPPPGYPAVLSGVLEPGESSRLRDVAAQHGATLNSLLTRELFLALADWRTRWNVPGADDWLRIMIPINLRTDGDRQLPAASLASFVCLDRRRQDFADRERLLNGIHEQMRAVLQRKLGFTFVSSCRALNLIPGMLRAHIRKPRCQVSTVLTNLGRTFVHSPLPRQTGRLVAGNVTLEGLDSVAPIRPYTCASFAATTYADRLTITLHYDPRPLTGPQAADLLDTFLRRLRTT